MDNTTRSRYYNNLAGDLIECTKLINPKLTTAIPLNETTTTTITTSTPIPTKKTGGGGSDGLMWLNPPEIYPVCMFPSLEDNVVGLEIDRQDQAEKALMTANELELNTYIEQLRITESHMSSLLDHTDNALTALSSLSVDFETIPCQARALRADSKRLSQEIGKIQLMAYQMGEHLNKINKNNKPPHSLSSSSPSSLLPSSPSSSPSSLQRTGGPAGGVNGAGAAGGHSRSGILFGWRDHLW